MSNDRIDLTQNFTLTFSAFLGSKDAGGSGIAFVLQNDPWGSDAFGGGASSQGANGIANGLAISLDTYKDCGRAERRSHELLRYGCRGRKRSDRGEVTVKPREFANGTL